MSLVSSLCCGQLIQPLSRFASFCCLWLVPACSPSLSPSDRRLSILGEAQSHITPSSFGSRNQRINYSANRATCALPPFFKSLAPRPSSLLLKNLNLIRWAPHLLSFNLHRLLRPRLAIRLMTLTIRMEGTQTKDTTPPRPWATRTMVHFPCRRSRNRSMGAAINVVATALDACGAAVGPTGRLTKGGAQIKGEQGTKLEADNWSWCQSEKGLSRRQRMREHRKGKPRQE